MKHRYIYIKADTIDPGSMVSVVPLGESLQDQRDFVYIQYQASHRSEVHVPIPSRYKT